MVINSGCRLTTLLRTFKGSNYTYTPTGGKVPLELGEDNVPNRNQDDVGMKTATSTSKRCYCKTATSTNKRHYRDQTLNQDSAYRKVEDFHQLRGYSRKGLSRKVNICTEARTTSPSHVDTTRQGPHTTVNGVNTVNMVNGTVNIGDFNAKNARSTHQDADESTLGLRG